jgi:hypothetical protein
MNSLPASTAISRLVLLAWCAMGVASTANAQGGWTGSVDTISFPSPIGEFPPPPAIAVDGKGNVTALWWRINGAVRVLESARYTATARSWTEPVQITGGPPGQKPDIAVNSQGDAVVAWLTVYGEDEGYVYATRYTAATGAWSSPVTLSTSVPGPWSDDPSVAIDREGNAFVVWAEGPATSAPPTVIKAARYSAAASGWEPARDLTPPNGTAVRVIGQEIAIDATGNAIVVWSLIEHLTGLIQVARYSAIAGTWTGASTVSTSQIGADPQIAVDGDGNVFIVWVNEYDLDDRFEYRVQAVHYFASTQTLVGPRTLAIGETFARKTLQVAISESGNAITVWTEHSGRIQAVPYTRAVDNWGDVITLGTDAPFGFVGVSAQVAMDSIGNAMVVWQSQGIVAARRTVTGSWSTTKLATSGFAQRVTVDSSGNATVIWRSTGVQATRWSATPTAPVITAIASGDAITVEFTALVDPEPEFATVNYDYSVDGGAHWTTRAPASTESPLTIGSLHDSAYSVQLRGVNRAGAGAPSSVVTVVVGSPPNPPTNLTAVSIVGSVVTIRWLPASNGMLATGYIVEGGPAPSSAAASIPTNSSAPNFTFTAPAGTFYLRVRATAGLAKSGPSNELQLSVNVPSPPSAPSGLLGLAKDAQLTLGWQNTFGGGTPSAVILDVSGAQTASIPFPVSERFSFDGVPAGTYTFAVRAVNAFGSSTASNAVTLSFPGTCSPPATPINFSATKTGNTILLAWSPPASGSAPSGYVVSVSGAFVGSFPTASLTLSGAAAPGTYTLSVYATSTCGDSPHSAPQVITVP